MNTLAPFFVGLFNMSNYAFCLLKFNNEETASAAKRLLLQSIFYDSERKPHQASWAPFGYYPEVLSMAQKIEHEDWANAPLVDWHDVLVGRYRPLQS